MSSNTPGATIDVALHQVADDPQIVELQAIVTIDKSTEVAKFNPIKARAAELVNEIQSTVYDIATTDGEDTAKALRRRCVSMRTSADAVYKTWNRPVLDAQTEMRAIVASIVKLVEPVELTLDTEIKAKEKTREDARLAKIAVEQARIRALRDKIKIIAGFPAAAARAVNASEIAALLGTLDGVTLEGAAYEEFMAEAIELHAEVRAQLADMLQAAQAREVQTAQLAAQALKLEAERQAQALAAKRASAILEIRGYPLALMGLTSGKMLVAINAAMLSEPESCEFGDMLLEAMAAHTTALTQMDGLWRSAVISERAAAELLLANSLAAQRRLDDEAAAEQRQREATASAVLLKNQQDAFEEERRIAAASIAADRERLAEERKVIQAQADALANPPVAAVRAEDDESTMPGTPVSDALLDRALASVSEDYIDQVVDQLFSQAPIVDAADTQLDDEKAWDIVCDVCWDMEIHLSALDRLFDTGTHAALVRLHAKLKAEQLEEIPA